MALKHVECDSQHETASKSSFLNRKNDRDSERVVLVEQESLRGPGPRSRSSKAPSESSQVDCNLQPFLLLVDLDYEL